MTQEHYGKVDVDKLLSEYDAEWQDWKRECLADYESENAEDDCREDFIRETVAIMGKDVLEDFASEYDTITTTDVGRKGA